MSGGPAGAGSLLRRAAGAAPFVFVVGKGGVGKSTAAGALAVELADAGERVHLVSTDPAHSLGDIFGSPIDPNPGPSPCTGRLVIEEFDAGAQAERWLAHASGPVRSIMEAGTYLDADDVAGFTGLALPGVDELMAVLRLVELVGDARVVVDTAPTGHTLRLLDAADTHASVAAALQAMADKAAAVASGMVGSPVNFSGAAFVRELDGQVDAYRRRVLAAAAFVVVTRADAVVAAETARLRQALHSRGLHVAATLVNAATSGGARDAGAAAPGIAGARLQVPVLAVPPGCDALRAWTAAVELADQAGEDPPAPRRGRAEPAAARAALPWLHSLPPRLLLFAGKGGVGKTTCAAAAACALAADRDVLLCSADPAGSLDDVLGEPATGTGRAGPRLRVLQVDAGASLQRLRATYREEAVQALERIGIHGSATLDRRVIDALWDLAPPGVDELAALAAILDAAASGETIVLDAAPTGHFLRLLSMPGLAMEWTRQLMRLIVKYRAAGAAAGIAESLLRTARELRGLQGMLHDPQRCGVVVVTQEHPVIAAESARLVRRLQAAAVPLAAVLYNRHAGAGAGAAGSGAMPRTLGAGPVPVILAPEADPPPAGATGLRGFIEAWKMVQ